MRRKLPVGQDGNTIVAPESIKPQLERKQLIHHGVAKEINLIRETREYELITPLFGGGTETQKADPVSVIRVPSIRGQLRFWWRATRGWQFETLKRMKEREDEIFGAASSADKARPSQVQFDLVIQNRGTSLSSVMNIRGTQQVEIHHISSPYGYIAFPLREGNLGVIEGTTFSLSLSYPAHMKSEFQAALWAWEMFGGIGGRTRRGFGALQRKNYRPSVSDLPKEIEEGFTKHLAGNKFPANVPHLSGGWDSIKITSPHNSVSEAWKYLTGELREFRQNRPWNPTRNRPGRSRWHEPDAIRILFGTTAPHSPSPSTVSKYPRALLGLPIIFQFNPSDVNAGDPPPTTLEGRDDNQKRMASPLILRPLACASNKAVGLAVILSGTNLPPGGIVLNGAPGNPRVYADLNETEAGAISPLDHKTNILEAFLNRLR